MNYQDRLKEKLYFASLRYLSLRPRSRKELKDYLDRKLYKRKLPVTDKAVVSQTVLARLETEGQIDDERFARFWVEDRSYFKPRGERALYSELKNKGVSTDIIEQALEPVKKSELKLARQLIESRRQGLSCFEGELKRQKVYLLLLRRGFSAGTIKNTIAEFDMEE